MTIDVKCAHCGRTIAQDDGIWFHPDTMSARCDGPDDEEGIAWSDLVRQAEPHVIDIDAFVNGYVTCAVWAGLDWSVVVDGENDNPDPLDDNYSVSDIAEETMEEIRREAREFCEANASDLSGIDPEQAGHDFYLTRNRHGAGYWDRGLGPVGDRLTDAAHAYGESDLYVGDDGKLYLP